VSNRISWIVTGFLVVSAFGQVPAPAQFEVASVRQNTANDRIVSISVGPGDRFTARGYTLVLLVQRAYGVMDWNVTGGPDWIRGDRFDIAAKASAAGNLTEQQLKPLLRALLAERFRLKVHESSKEMPGHALVVAKGGPKLKASAAVEENGDSFRLNQEGLRGEGISIPTFARFVAGKLGWVGMDETGLKGLYDFDVHWKVEPDQSISGLPGNDPRDALRFAATTAIEEQLGLKLTAKRITVPVIVIDNVEKPLASEN
jgi:uncharacterized protein (TIGR03435 family)